jgi:hypothetical protein
MRNPSRWITGAIAASAFSAAATAAIPNHGFESGRDGWRPLFTHEPRVSQGETVAEG